MNETFADKIEILELKRAEVRRTGSPFDWQEGYPEKCWNIIKNLDNGKFIENDKQISFRNSKGEEIGIGYLKEGFLYERNKDFVSYWTPGGSKIVKRLDELGILEITDRVGNYCKLRVEPVFQDLSFQEHTLYTQVFNKEQLSLLSQGFNQNFIPQEKIRIEQVSENMFKLYFESIALLQSKLNGYKFRGTFERGDESSKWLQICSLINNIEEERGLNLDFLETLKHNNYNTYL